MGILKGKESKNKLKILNSWFNLCNFKKHSFNNFNKLFKKNIN